MAISFLRRRAPEATQGGLSPTAKAAAKLPRLRPPCHFSTTFLCLALLCVWCTSLLFSGAFFHVCVTSRKLKVYCIHANFAREPPRSTLPIENPQDHHHPVPNTTVVVPNATRAADSTAADEREEDHHPVPNTTEVAPNATRAADSTAADERKEAIREVESQVGALRALGAAGSDGGGGCEGRGVYVYELPLRFNWDIMGYCHEMLPWLDLCGYFSNDAMGEPLSPSSFGKGWYRTHQYALEPIFHQRVLRHRCRVWSSDQARLFYVPFYAGLDVLRLNFQNASAEAKDALGRELVQWLQTQPSWQRNGGKDHVFVLGKIAWDFRRNGSSNWGNSFLSLPEMANPFKLMLERQPWEPRDVGIPHPTLFHPHSDDDIAAWQHRVISSPRKHTVSFVGAPRRDPKSIRGVLIDQCKSAGDRSCNFRDCWNGNCDRTEEVIGMFMESDFCLQPVGDSPTRKSVFDGLVAGCIPVFFDPFTAYYQYPWHLPGDHGQYSVFVDEEDVRKGKLNVVEKLCNISVRQKEEMRRFIVYEIMPGLVYGDATSEFHRYTDAFGIAMWNLMNAVASTTTVL